MTLQACCRYISEVYGGLALHPVDLVDMGTGRQLAALTGGILTCIMLLGEDHICCGCVICKFADAQ